MTGFGGLIGSAAAPFISSGLNALLGTGKKNKNALNFDQAFDPGPPLDFSGDLGAKSLGIDYARPALNGLGASGGGYRLGATANADGTISGALDGSGTFAATTLAPRLNRSLSDIDALRAGLQPGFGKVTEARRAAVETARQKAVGDLRDTLGRRRVEGSSFANASLAQADAEFAKAAADADAKSYLEELAATSDLIDRENKYLYQEAARGLEELGLAARFQREFADIFARDAQARLNAAETDLSTRRSLYGQEIASRRNAGVQDLMNRRELALREEQGADETYAGFGKSIGGALGGALKGGIRLPSFLA